MKKYFWGLPLRVIPLPVIVSFAQADAGYNFLSVVTDTVWGCMITRLGHISLTLSPWQNNLSLPFFLSLSHTHSHFRLLFLLRSHEIFHSFFILPFTHTHTHSLPLTSTDTHSHSPIARVEVHTHTYTRSQEKWRSVWASRRQLWAVQ